MKHLKAINKYFWKYRIRLSAGILFIIVSNYFAILSPQVTAFIINKVQQLLEGGQGKASLTQTDWLVNAFIGWMDGQSFGFAAIVTICGISILVLAIIRGVFMFFMRQTIIVMSRHIEFDQKNEIYAHYQQLDAAFYKVQRTGDLMNRIAEDVSRVRMYTGPAIMYSINLLTIIVFAVSNMLAKNVTLTLYVLSPLPILAVAIYYVNSIINKRSEKIQEQLSDLTTNAQQSYSGIRVIKSYVQEKAMMGFFTANSEKYRDQSVGLAKVEAFYFPSIVFLIGVSTLLTIMMGGLFYLRGDIQEVGIIVEFMLYINMLQFPVSAIGWVASMIQRAAASQKRLNEFLDTKPAILSPTNAVSPELKGDISFSDVSFQYQHTGIWALRKFSMDIVAGERIAIIGKTGSGKSSIAQLLLRMFDPTSGAISLDGIPLQNMSLAALRNQISYVPQDVFLFSDTIKNNIRFGNQLATDAAVRQMATMSAIDKEINGFESGYQTMVGERGITLSGGQKQRISIARALMKPAPIIVFDDCLSAVDAATEQEILLHLDTFLRDKTAIIITHRIFSLMNFDKILVLDDGCLVESGTHDSLLAMNGTYAAMYRLQQEPAPALI